jgi:bla regulator protein blaR1
MKALFLCFSYNLNYALGWTVIHALWQATFIAFLAAILLLILRKKTAQLRYMVSSLAMASVLVLAIGTFVYHYDFTKTPGQVVFIPEKKALSEALNAQIGQGSAVENSTSFVKTAFNFERMQVYFNQNLPLVVTIWALGVVFFVLRLLGGISFIYYLKSRMNFPADEFWLESLQNLAKKAGLSKPIELVESALVRTPMVVGHLKPIIMFPIGIINRLSAEEVEGILAHELAHVMRNDYVVNILQSLVEALFYFHPAVWWLSSQVRNERESCCDDIAIQLCNNNSMGYARALVTAQEMAFFPLSPSLAFSGQRKTQLSMRIHRILKNQNSKSNTMEKLITTGVLALLIGSFALSGNNRPALFDAPSTLAALNLDTRLQDSLPSNVQDGVYNYTDQTQNIRMRVQNGAVVTMDINGLEIQPQDLSKFDALANKMVRIPVPPAPPAPAAPPTAPGFSAPPAPLAPPAAPEYWDTDGNISFSVGTKSMSFRKGRKGMQINANGIVLRKDGQVIEIFKDDKGGKINGKSATKKEIEVAIESIKWDEEDADNSFSYGYSSDGNDKRAEKARRDAEQRTRDAEQAARDAEQAGRDAEQAGRDAEQAGRDAEQAHRDSEQAERDKRSGEEEDAFWKTFAREFKKLGYIDDEKRYRVTWNDESLEINGKTIPKTTAETWRKRYEAVRNEKLREFSLMRHVKGNQVTNSLSIE